MVSKWWSWPVARLFKTLTLVHDVSHLIRIQVLLGLHVCLSKIYPLAISRRSGFPGHNSQLARFWRNILEKREINPIINNIRIINNNKSNVKPLNCLFLISCNESGSRSSNWTDTFYKTMSFFEIVMLTVPKPVIKSTWIKQSSILKGQFFKWVNNLFNKMSYINTIKTYIHAKTH